MLSDQEYKKKMEEAYKDIMDRIYDPKNTSISSDDAIGKVERAAPVLKEILVFGEPRIVY